MNPSHNDIPRHPDCVLGDQLAAYHDGELAPSLARRFEAHLADCPACTRELDELRRISEAVRGASAATLDPAALARIHQQVHDQPDPAVLRTLYRLAAAAAVVLLVCGLEQVRVDQVQASAAPAGEWELAAVTTRPDDAAAPPRLASWFYHELSQDDQP